MESEFISGNTNSTEKWGCFMPMEKKKKKKKKKTWKKTQKHVFGWQVWILCKWAYLEPIVDHEMVGKCF